MSTSEPSLRLADGTDAASTLIDSTDSIGSFGSVRADQRLPGPPPHGGRLTSRLAHPDVRDRWLDKVAHLRIFADDAGKMNRSVLDIGGGVLVVSQFTLYGDARQGRRPGFTGALEPVAARGAVV